MTRKFLVSILVAVILSVVFSVCFANEDNSSNNINLGNEITRSFVHSKTPSVVFSMIFSTCLKLLLSPIVLNRPVVSTPMMCEFWGTTVGFTNENSFMIRRISLLRSNRTRIKMHKMRICKTQTAMVISVEI